MKFEELAQKSIEILKQTNTRKSAQGAFDVFFGMFNDGYFDGYGQAESVKDEFGFYEFFYETGNADVWVQVKAWYKNEFGSRKPVAQKMTTISVGDLLEETDKAYGFDGGKIYRTGKPVIIWVPKSQVTYNSKRSTLELPVWLAQEKSYMQVK